MSKRKFDLIGYIDNRRKIIPTFLKAQIEKALFKSDNLMVNIGSGVWHSPHWKSLDFYTTWYGGGFWWKKTIDYNYDLTSMTPLPFKNNSVDLFYSEYAFEHIPLHCAKYVFKELCRCLKNGGGFRVIVPDIDIIYQKFKNNERDIFEHYSKQHNGNYVLAFLSYFSFPDFSFSEKEFLDDFGRMPKERLLDKYTPDRRQQKDTAGHHISWFNFSKLQGILRDAGFTEIVRSEYKKSVFKEMRKKRFDTRMYYPGLYVECVKRGK